MPFNAKGIRKGDRSLAVRRTCDFGRQLEGFLGLGPVPQITFHVGDLRGLDDFPVNVGDGEVHAGAEICVHGALAVRRHQDEGARGGRAVGGRFGIKSDALCPHVMPEDGAELICLHLAKIGCFAAQ